MYLGKFLVHSLAPQKLYTAGADLDLPLLQPGCRVPTGHTACSHPGLGFVWLEGRREGLEESASWAPLTIYMSIVKRKFSDPAPRAPCVLLGLVLITLHGAWKPLAASRHLANSAMKDFSPSSES